MQDELIHGMLNRQYRSLLDEPVPMLGNRTSRAAARSARGRRDVVVWLKHLENRSSHALDPVDPMATDDFTWLWREIGGRGPSGLTISEAILHSSSVAGPTERFAP